MAQEMNLEQAAGWRPEPGDTLIGTLTSIDKGWSDYLNDFYPILTLTDDDGNATAVHCFQSGLKNKVMDARPQLGSTVGIKFHGKRPTKDGKREVAVYGFRVKGEQRDPWASMAGPAAPVAPVQESLPVDSHSDDDIPF